MKEEIQAGDKIRRNNKEIIVKSETESTYHGFNGGFIHKSEDIKIVEKAETKDKKMINDLKRGETIRINDGLGNRVYKIASITKYEDSWTISFVDGGHLNNVNRNLTIGIEGRGGDVEIIKPINKNNLRCFE